MLQALQVITVIHALELPGKLRLSKEHYLAVQTIYYPGFTIGGAGEFVGLLALLALVIATPKDTAAFWLTLSAFIVMLATHAIYWIVVHPVNNFWLKDFKLKPFSAAFFLFDPLKRAAGGGTADWTALRDQWEYGHAARAALALLGLTLLTTAVAL